MRRRSVLLLLASVCLIPTLAHAQDVVSGFEGGTFRGSGGVTLPYRLFKVKDPAPGTKYPLVLFLHGAGERGDDNTAQLMANQGATVWASDAHQAAHPAYVLAPQCPAGEQWVDTPWADGSYSITDVPISDELATVLELADELASQLAIDPDRHYITGLSMGGYGTWDAILRNPTRFAAAIPICGAGDPSKADLIKDLPIWTAHGDADNVVPPSGSRDMVMALESAGSDVRYSEYPGVGHDSWVQTYANEEIIDWLFTHQRELPPVGGAAGAAGMAGSGGAAGVAGVSGNGGTSANGGASGASAGGADQGGGAGASSAGAPSAGSTVGSGATPPRDDSGCSFAGVPARSDAWLMLIAFLALATCRSGLLVGLPRRAARPLDRT